MIVALVLAAGASRRFGAHKLLADVHGRPLVRRSVEAALGSVVEEVVVVLGREAERVRGALDGLDARLVINPRFSEGMSSSLRVGIASLGGEVAAAVIVLADQPLHGPWIIDRLVAAHRSSGRPIVVPTYGGVRGNPVLFHADVFPELLAVKGDRGGREVVDADPARVLEVAFPHPPPPDVDTPDDYRRLLAALAPPADEAGSG